jgi:hypothetical protein
MPGVSLNPVQTVKGPIYQEPAGGVSAFGTPVASLTRSPPLSVSTQKIPATILNLGIDYQSSPFWTEDRFERLRGEDCRLLQCGYPSTPHLSAITGFAAAGRM